LDVLSLPIGLVDEKVKEISGFSLIPTAFGRMGREGALKQKPFERFKDRLVEEGLQPQLRSKTLRRAIMRLLKIVSLKSYYQVALKHVTL